MTSSCWFGYDPQSNCTQTVAEMLGPGYKAYMGLYLSLSCILLIVALYSLVAIHRKVQPASDIQKHMLVLSSICLVAFIVRNVDPFSYGLVLPTVVSGLAFEVGAASVLGMVYMIVFSWFNFFQKALMRGALQNIYKHIYYGSHVLTWVILVSIGLSQYEGPYSWYTPGYAIKLLIIAFILFLYVIGGAVYGIRIFNLLSESERRWGGKSRSEEEHASNRTETDTHHASSRNSETGGARASKSAKKEVSLANKKRLGAIKKVYRLLTAATICELLGVIAIIYRCSSQISEMTDQGPKPSSPPTSLGGMLLSGAFDIVQMAGCMIAIYFFRPNRPPSETDNNESSISSVDQSELKDVYVAAPGSSKIVVADEKEGQQAE